jgi:hypothetical protein
MFRLFELKDSKQQLPHSDVRLSDNVEVKQFMCEECRLLGYYAVWLL